MGIIAAATATGNNGNDEKKKHCNNDIASIVCLVGYCVTFCRVILKTASLQLLLRNEMSSCYVMLSKL